MNYYNEIDDYAATWIENLILDGLIPNGEVDRRSILDVRASEVRGYVQCHFFAGIAGWPLALQLAGWPADRPIWTGSCPCQPFSHAGRKGGGFDDERHLWPEFFRLIRECGPSVVLGEQVASKDAEPWLDLVFADLESLDYACGAVAFPSASVGAPHIRDRTYWMGYANSARLEGFRGGHTTALGQRQTAVRPASEASCAMRMADSTCFRLDETRQGRTSKRSDGATGNGQHDRPTETNGFWRGVDWLGCRDEKWRPVEPGTFPLANGVPTRVEQLRAYGNAINPQQGAIFVQAVMDCMP